MLVVACDLWLSCGKMLGVNAEMIFLYLLNKLALVPKTCLVFVTCRQMMPSAPSTAKYPIVSAMNMLGELLGH